MNKWKSAILLGALLLTAQVSAQDWPRFRGPQGSGVAPEATFNADALKGTPNIIWESNVGMGHGTITLSGNRLFTSGNKSVVAGTDTLHEDILYCFDAEDGRELWHFAHPCPDRDWPGPRTTPTVDDGLVYHLTWQGDFFALDVETGRLIWRINLVESGLTRRNNWGFSGSPVINGNALYLNCGKSGVAFNKKSGEIIWKSEAEIYGLTTPVLFEFNGQHLGIFSSEREIHAVRLENGERLWSYEWKTCNDPVVIGDKVLLTGNHDRKQSCMLQLTEGEPAMIWESEVIMGWAFQNIVIKDGHAYGFGHHRRDMPIQCFDLATGEMKWHQSFEGEYGAFIMAGSYGLILDGDGDLIIAEFTPEAYTEKSSAKILPMAPAGDLPPNRQNFCWTEPVLHQGKAYVRGNYGNLACVSLTP